MQKRVLKISSINVRFLSHNLGCKIDSLFWTGQYVSGTVFPTLEPLDRHPPSSCSQAGGEKNQNRGELNTAPPSQLLEDMARDVPWDPWSSAAALHSSLT